MLGSASEQDGDIPAYYVAYGNKKGTPSCRGCGKLFEDKSELRILTTMMWTTPHSTKSTPVKINFCLNSVCVQQGIMKRYSKV